MEAEFPGWTRRMISGWYGSKLSVPLTVVQRRKEMIKSRNRCVNG